MTKGYLVFEIEITDPAAYETYRELASHLPTHYGGKLIIGRSKIHSLEGGWTPVGFFVFEFPSYAQARAFYFSEDYQKVLPLRLAASNSKALLIEGTADD